jgi:hypothetical protein
MRRIERSGEKWEKRGKNKKMGKSGEKWGKMGKITKK